MKSQKRSVVKNTRCQKENDSSPIAIKSNISNKNKPLRSQRKALADKTNSGSDDNSLKDSAYQFKKQFASPESKRSNSNNGLSSLQRPRRTHRLPSKFEDHAVTPLNFLFSTNSYVSSTPNKEIKNKFPPEIEIDQNQKTLSEPSKSDTNNNPQKPSTRQVFTTICEETQCYKPKETIVERKPVNQEEPIKTSENKLTNILNETSKQNGNKNEKSTVLDKDKLDVYEFDFDPSEEPPTKKIKKKKRKYMKRKKVDNFFFLKGSTYKINISKTVQSLKDVIKEKKVHTVNFKEPLEDNSKKESLTSDTNFNGPNEFDYEEPQDINLEENNDLVLNAETASEINQMADKNTGNQSDLSFFDDMPVTHSSFNTTNLNNKPAGSPWRVELNGDPKKWPVNFYVKPSMTPAYESTFQHISLDRNSSNINQHPRKTGKYMNEICDPTLFENNIEKLKQTSILSFFEDVVTKSVEKLKIPLEVITPQKNYSSSLNRESNNGALHSVKKSIFNTPPKQTPKPLSEINRTVLCELNVNSPVRPDKSSRNIEVSSPSKARSPATSPDKKNKDKTKNKDKNQKENYYGFESDGQENVSPNVNANRRRVYGWNAREQHKQRRLRKLPMRMDLEPLKVTRRIGVTEVVDKGSQIKEKNLILSSREKAASLAAESENLEQLAGSDSSEEIVCLFEDDLPKANNVNIKCYDRSKPPVQQKRKISISSSDDSSDVASEVEEEIEEPPALFTVKPKRTVKRRKKEVKPKEEDKEADAWAASFNSMLEEVDEFPLIIE